MRKVKSNYKPGSKEIALEGMFKDYFLDYASYVILERAVPTVEDGCKPVQRRLLHAMKKMDDGRFHKVANIIGQTMQYHPHGDTSIGDALVKLGQKDLLIDCQGNWGDLRTGDSAAASRYIEARLTKFALEVVFNPQTTEWQMSYDGRKQEPINLPVKFPMILAQGVEGIAVGLSTKILPHNFIELIKASIKVLKDKPVKLYPDFQTGGLIDVSEYNSGKRGSRVKVRARINQIDKNTLEIVELPFGVTTTNLIDSIIKANEKGKIKIKKITDNTARDVSIILKLHSGISPDQTLNALYAFTNCQVSISPNACVIIDNKPEFLTVRELLKISTAKTKELLRQELLIRQGELEEKWHNASLEKIFIENRIYRDIEECESFEEVLVAIKKGLLKYVSTPSEKAKKSDKRLKLKREITEEDLVRLTEIKIKRISKYNTFDHDQKILKTEEELKQVRHDLKNLTAYAVKYFENLLAKYGKGRERRTDIMEFDDIKAVKVVAKNSKLYANMKEGFIGHGMKKDEFIANCSDIDNIIGFAKDGKYKVVKIDDKVYIGKNLQHVAVWKKGDDRTTYNVIYLDGKTGRAMAKRFQVKGITRNKEYDVTKGHKGSKVLYITANPNGEAEKVNIQLSPGCKAKKKNFDFDFNEIAIKGRASGGNIITKYPIRKVTLTEKGLSSLGAMEVWMDEVSGNLNKSGQGRFLGAFDTGDLILSIFKDGSYMLNALDLDKKHDLANIVDIKKFDPELPINVVYFEGEKGWTMVKRFKVDTTTLDQKYLFISEASGSKLYYANHGPEANIKYAIMKDRSKKEIDLSVHEFMDLKGWKAAGNKLGEFKILKVNELKSESLKKKEDTDLLKPGDTIELDL